MNFTSGSKTWFSSKTNIRFEFSILNYLWSNFMENWNIICWYHFSWRIPAAKLWCSDIRFELPEPNNL